MEQFSFEKASNEAEQVRKRALEKVEAKKETGEGEKEPTRDDYMEAHEEISELSGKRILKSEINFDEIRKNQTEKENARQMKLEKEMAEGKNDELSDFVKKATNLLEEFVQKDGEPFSDENIGILIEQIIEANEKAKCCWEILSADVVSLEEFNEAKRLNAEFSSSSLNLKDSLDSVIKNCKKVIIGMRESETASEYDKFLLETLHDRLSNDISKAEWSSVGIEPSIYYIFEKKYQDVKGGKFKNYAAAEADYQSIYFSARSLYHMKSFFANMENMLQSLETIVKKEGNVGYGKESFRNTEFQQYMKKQEKGKKDENGEFNDEESVQAFKESSRDARFMQEPWEKEFNRLEDAGLLDLSEVV